MKKKIRKLKIIKLKPEEFKQLEQDLERRESKLEPVKKKGFMACKRKKKRRK